MNNFGYLWYIDILKEIFSFIKTRKQTADFLKLWTISLDILTLRVSYFKEHFPETASEETEQTEMLSTKQIESNKDYEVYLQLKSIAFATENIDLLNIYCLKKS